MLHSFRTISYRSISEHCVGRMKPVVSVYVIYCTKYFTCHVRRCSKPAQPPALAEAATGQCVDLRHDVCHLGTIRDALLQAAPRNGHELAPCLGVPRPGARVDEADESRVGAIHAAAVGGRDRVGALHAAAAATIVASMISGRPEGPTAPPRVLSPCTARAF